MVNIALLSTLLSLLLDWPPNFSDGKSAYLVRVCQAWILNAKLLFSGGRSLFGAAGNWLFEPFEGSPAPQLCFGLAAIFSHDFFASWKDYVWRERLRRGCVVSNVAKIFTELQRSELTSNIFAVCSDQIWDWGYLRKLFAFERVPFVLPNLQLPKAKLVFVRWKTRAMEN